MAAAVDANTRNGLPDGRATNRWPVRCQVCTPALLTTDAMLMQSHHHHHDSLFALGAMSVIKKAVSKMSCWRCGATLCVVAYCTVMLYGVMQCSIENNALMSSVQNCTPPRETSCIGDADLCATALRLFR